MIVELWGQEVTHIVTIIDLEKLQNRRAFCVGVHGNIAA